MTETQHKYEHDEIDSEDSDVLINRFKSLDLMHTKFICEVSLPKEVPRLFASKAIFSQPIPKAFELEQDSFEFDASFTGEKINVISDNSTAENLAAKSNPLNKKKPKPHKLLMSILVESDNKIKKEKEPKCKNSKHNSKDF